jgi:hypothetical protein
MDREGQVDQIRAIRVNSLFKNLWVAAAGRAAVFLPLCEAILLVAAGGHAAALLCRTLFELPRGVGVMGQ